jgi:hypothetical protein
MEGCVIKPNQVFVRADILIGRQYDSFKLLNVCARIYLCNNLLMGLAGPTMEGTGLLKIEKQNEGNAYENPISVQ